MISYPTITRISLALCALLSTGAQAQCDVPVELGKLQPPGLIAHGNFGNAVAVHGDVAIIGGYRDTDNGDQSGSAFIYRFDGSNWNYEQKLTASEGEPFDWFGYSVDIEGDTAIVGAPNSFGQAFQSGAVYIYEFSGTHWVETQKLFPSEGVAGDNFGVSVSISASRMIIGADQRDDLGFGSGAAYIYELDIIQWIQVAKLLNSTGAAADLFGSSVAISNMKAVVGSPGNDLRGSWAGSATAFETDGSTWTQYQTLAPIALSAGDSFGTSVAIYDDNLVVGAPFSDINGSDSGEVYTYSHSQLLGWFEWQPALIPFDGAPDDWFGYSVAVTAGGTIAIGSMLDDDQGSATGSVYLYEPNLIFGWEFAHKVYASDGAFGANFGESVDISGDSLLVGKPQAYDGASVTGAAYAYNLNPTISPCPPDLNTDCNLDFFDVSLFLTAFGNQDPIADFSGDGLFDFFDVSAFLAAFGAGCP